MPITQERFMTIVTGAKRVLDVQRKTKEIIRQTLTENISDINSILTHSQDENAKQALRDLVQTFHNIRNAFFDLSDSDTDELIGILLAEEIHFKRVGARNKRARYYQAQTRRERGIPQRAPEAELEKPMLAMRSIPLAPPAKDFTNDPNYIKFQEETRKKYWPAQAAQAPEQATPLPIAHADIGPEPKATNEQIIASERSDNATMFPNTALPLDEAAERELALMQAEAAKHNGMRPGYKDASVIATSTPADEVLYAPPLPIGKNVL